MSDKGVGMKVWLLMTGSGEDGNPRGVVSIHSSEDGAERAKDAFEAPIERTDGTHYHHESDGENFLLPMTLLIALLGCATTTEITWI